MNCTADDDEFFRPSAVAWTWWCPKCRIYVAQRDVIIGRFGCVHHDNCTTHLEKLEVS